MRMIGGDPIASPSLPILLIDRSIHQRCSAGGCRCHLDRKPRTRVSAPEFDWLGK
jgi:hypothetical protein